MTDVYPSTAGLSVAGSTILDVTSGRLEYPQSFAEVDTWDQYAGVLSGVLYPPRTGKYRFYLRSDAASALFLSEDDTFPALPHPFPEPDFVASTPIVEETDCCDPFGEDAASEEIMLETGKGYAFEAVWKEGDGVDFLQVGWSFEGGPIEVIPLKYVQRDVRFFPPNANQLTGPVRPDGGFGPLDFEVSEGRAAEFFVEFDRATAPQIQWQVSEDGAEWADIPGAVSTALDLERVTLAETGRTYRAVINEVEISAEAMLTVNPDTEAPFLTEVRGSGYPHGILVAFSEDVDPDTATNVAHYGFTPTKTIRSVQMLTPRQVLIDIGDYDRSSLNLSVTGVTDLAATPNSIEDGGVNTWELNFGPGVGAVFLFYDFPNPDFSTPRRHWTDFIPTVATEIFRKTTRPSISPRMAPRRRSDSGRVVGFRGSKSRTPLISRQPQDSARWITMGSWYLVGWRRRRRRVIGFRLRLRVIPNSGSAGTADRSTRV